MSLPTGRNHRTALVIDVRDTDDEFTERYTRLLQSVNGSNIKVDVHTLRGNATNDGPGLVKGAPNTFVAPDQPEKEIDLKAWAASEGYDLLLVAVRV